MRTGTRRQLWNPWQELDSFRREVTTFLNGGAQWREDWSDGPAFNVLVSEDGVILTAELPGYDSEAFDISVRNDTVTIRGRREAEAVEGATYHVRERASTEFEKSFRLPFAVEADKTEAAYEKGVLTVTLPRPQEQKPHKIGVRTA